jgi:hypothetical protein
MLSPLKGFSDVSKEEVWVVLWSVKAPDVGKVLIPEVPTDQEIQEKG